PGAPSFAFFAKDEGPISEANSCSSSSQELEAGSCSSGDPMTRFRKPVAVLQMITNCSGTSRQSTAWCFTVNGSLTPARWDMNQYVAKMVLPTSITTACQCG